MVCPLESLRPRKQRQQSCDEHNQTGPVVVVFTPRAVVRIVRTSGAVEGVLNGYLNRSRRYQRFERRTGHARLYPAHALHNLMTRQAILRQIDGWRLRCERRSSQNRGKTEADLHLAETPQSHK